MVWRGKYGGMNNELVFFIKGYSCLMKFIFY